MNNKRLNNIEGSAKTLDLTRGSKAGMTDHLKTQYAVEEGRTNLGTRTVTSKKIVDYQSLEERSNSISQSEFSGMPLKTSETKGHLDIKKSSLSPT